MAMAMSKTWQPWALKWPLLALLPLSSSTACTADLQCDQACIAGNGASCDEALCDTTFARCDCSGSVLMRSDLHNASCEAVIHEAVQCDPAFRVTFTVAAAPAPEVTAQDVQSGQPSDKLEKLVALGVAAGLRAGLNEVAVSNLTIETGADAAGSVPTTLLFYDLVFAFCSSRARDWDSFEADFKAKVQSYAAFGAPATLAMQSPVQNLTSAQSAPSPTNSPWTGGSEEPGKSSNDGGVLIWILIVATAILLAFALAVSVWAKIRQHRAKVHDAPDLEAPDVDRVLAHVACAFSPADVEDDKVFRESCLDLSEGDIVEVIAGGGGWFYGRIISSTSSSTQVIHMGCFPENRVSWIGKIPRVSEEVTSADQHALVSVEMGFSPQDLEGDEVMKEHCLQVEAGEIVEVLAGGAGWLYGQVAGHPERAGYFPENRANWLGECAENEEAARTQQGVLVRVVQDFAPGSPGDKEEEVAFADSCLALAEGDVVEVAASGGGWVYGRVVGAPDRHGYFPETRVSWLGRPVASEPTSPASQPEENDALREAAAVQAPDPEQGIAMQDGISSSRPASPG